MVAKRGRIPAVHSYLIDDELLKNKNQINDVLSFNETDYFRWTHKTNVGVVVP